ncbi:MAG: UDP-N-acetylmuramoyl-L-alanine--D-glutamate ligase [Wenzhouxiangella sp.]|nr:MAG: UDP-N-acetylmuramoyl-L-alanine--D-glutamate ligase [Wenzhouxiangella sp.]
MLSFAPWRRDLRVSTFPRSSSCAGRAVRTSFLRSCWMRLEQFDGKRIAILGWGREGQCAAATLSQRLPDAKLSVLVERGPRPAHWPGWTGSFDERLEQFDILLRSPGVPVDHPALVAASRTGVSIVNPASIWFSQRPDVPVIGVTGSKGKSTTASLLAHLLQASGYRVLLAGNIGEPLLGHLDLNADYVVLELSSYQLTDLDAVLTMGLFTRLFDEHLDWHGSRAAYFASKLRIADLLAGRPLLVNAADPLLLDCTRRIEGLVQANRWPEFHRRGDSLWLDDHLCLDLAELNLTGRHNLDNAALALAAARRLGGRTETLLEALRSFRPLAHRLEPLARQAGLDWVNDSISTSPHATRAALESLADRPITLIVGGQNRPADWQPVLEWCRSRPLAALVALPDTGRVVAEVLREGGCVANNRICQVDNLGEAVAAAATLSAENGVVLLSPGAPSFPRFQDFEARGDAFRQAVADYSDRSTA